MDPAGRVEAGLGQLERTLQRWLLLDLEQTGIDGRPVRRTLGHHTTDAGVVTMEQPSRRRPSGTPSPPRRERSSTTTWPTFAALVAHAAQPTGDAAHRPRGLADHANRDLRLLVTRSPGTKSRPDVGNAGFAAAVVR
jgi:hypothetical protein